MARKSLEDIGERKVIDVIKGLLTGGNIAIGIGDDCAAIDLGDEYLLITTDMINESTHIPKASAEQIGWHLVAINLSDIASKGGRPLGVVTALGLPRKTGIEFVKGLHIPTFSRPFSFEKDSSFETNFWIGFDF